MKKIRFSLPILALALGIAASAFTSRPAAKNTDLNTFYWYYFDGTNLTGPVSEDKISHSSAAGLTTCDDTSGPDCARGYDNELSGDFPQAPPMVTGDNILRD
jgi:hypothetical protein